jgi:Domain of unknown function (DUF5069)
VRAAEMVRRPGRSGRWGAAAACQCSFSLLDFSRPPLYVLHNHNSGEIKMTQQTYPRSPKALLGGIAHLGRFIDKIRLRHEGKIQEYNYITVGFDKYLVDFLQIDPKAFEQRVLAGGTDEELLSWVKANSRKPSDQEIAQWSQELLSSGPKDDAARQRFQGRLDEIAKKRAVPVSSLPPISTWVNVIELDEGRM